MANGLDSETVQSTVLMLLTADPESRVKSRALTRVIFRSLARAGPTPKERVP
jgi:hypothetical protein